ncbi:hypothetical protein P170DRAFT_414784 [Aspergillus steynii IBT 23096]|uniref:N-acetylglucosaminylphosphatidylinositol deacetylase n=1 Tax=Aspergillus steynii IBT 23096 TaxID=1392250 RepID=A0A2I2FZE3_9EURO|nr:uncharacterized protein P170DRAFT_414784 [Aspergillus steynii IBT 23096]PLB45997.1 hypothetical protein P170DRAFT_414784 [Aspergillus steynii IBT 23096]
MKSTFAFRALFLIAQYSLATAQQTLKTLNIVAHQDDDLLFLSPDLLHNVHGGAGLRTIFLTAGDAGNDWAYWNGRQAGSLAAYAQMAGVANEWTESDSGAPDTDIPVYTLNGRSDISLAFLQLPDGGLDGTGWESTHHVSLLQLWNGDLESIETLTGSTSYTKDKLLSTLAWLIEDFDPLRINTMDYVNDVNIDFDHPDHSVTGFFADNAERQSTSSAELVGYLGYSTKDRTPNVGGDDLQQKQDTFFFYAGYDPGTCNSVQTCSGRPELEWLSRSYIL